MNRRNALQFVGTAGLMVGSGCLGTLQGSNSKKDRVDSSTSDGDDSGGGESGKWGLPSCGSGDYPIEVQAAKLETSKEAMNVNRPYDASVKLVVKNTDVDNRVVEVKATPYADGQQLDPSMYSDPYLVEGGSTKQFSPSLGYNSDPTEFTLSIQSMPKDEYDDASSGEWLEQDNSACT